MSVRYLTKSRFKLALECPTKLFYTKKPDIYPDQKLDDPFLKALASGGFQVGELAKCYYPEGIEIEGLDYEKSWSKTQEYLKQENVVLFEAAIKFENLFVRVDILKKTGTKIELIEVKSKSFNAKTFEKDLWQKKNANKLDSKWFPYMMDIAFQSHVAKSAFPKFKVESFLMCADKETIASVDGLNQKFFIEKTKVKKMGDTSLSALGTPVLTAINVTDAVEKIHLDIEETSEYKNLGFKETVKFFADHFEKDLKIAPETDNKCKSCEFRISIEGFKSGFNECFKTVHGLTDIELEKPFAFDVWFSPKLKENRILMEDIEASDFVVKPNAKNEPGLSRSERQWLQIEKVQNNDESEFIDRKGIEDLFKTFKYPLHFIDFETSMVAIPFNKGRHPYEQMAFQFSHHIMFEDGRYEHAGEWIETTPGKFPNFDFVRALKKSLSSDAGTIFRYSNHENTVLNQIFEQLLESKEPDREELSTWIKEITQDREEGWVGPRNMVDLCEIIKSFYYHPETHGSNSIKYVLPAILKAQGKNADPYGSLPVVFDNYDRETLDLLMSEDDIRNGGAAMTAYALMQFSEMSDQERSRIKEALLRYCKLDTEAMVWIYQYLFSD